MSSWSSWSSWRMRDATLTEWLDADSVESAELERNLADIRRINALLGWTAFTSREVLAWTRRDRTRDWTLLDVASGSADIPIAIAKVAQREGIHLNITATDRSPRIAGIARQQAAGIPGVTVDIQDALDLPYDDGAFDIALCTLALHHFEPAAARALLAAMGRVARRIFVYDVVRSPLAWAGVVALTRIAMMSRMTSHDGPASVRRAYSLDEALTMARAAGLRNIEARVRIPYRLTLMASGAGGSASDAL